VWCVCVWCVCMCARVPCIAMEGKLLIIDIQLNLVSARFEYRLGHHASWRKPSEIFLVCCTQISQ